MSIIYSICTQEFYADASSSEYNIVLAQHTECLRRLAVGQLHRSLVGNPHFVVFQDEVDALAYKLMICA